MNTLLLVQLAGGFAAGAVIAWLFLRALHGAVDRLPGRAHPGRVLLAGAVLRMALTVASFALVAWLAQGPGVVAALAGFLVVRTWRVRQVRRDLAAPRQDGPAR